MTRGVKDPRQDEVVRWMTDNGRGYKAAARHFGISRTTVKNWGRSHRNRNNTPTNEVLQAEAAAEEDATDLTVAVEATPPTLVRDAEGTARDAIGKLSPGMRIVGITKGQFSMLDVIRAITVQTGPADICISTWTAGLNDVETLGYMYQQGELRSVRLLVDASLPARKPNITRRFVELLGLESIRLTHTHAKLALISNDDWHITIRGSFNLSRNPRFEQFDLDESHDIWRIFCTYFDVLWSDIGRGTEKRSADVTQAFRKLFAGTFIAGEKGIALPPLSVMHPIPFWSGRVDSAMDAAAVALSRGHANAAATWEKMGYAAREKLDESRRADEARRRREEAAAVRDPVELAARLVRRMPSLLRIVDDVAVADAVIEEIAAWKGTL